MLNKNWRIFIRRGSFRGGVTDFYLQNLFTCLIMMQIADSTKDLIKLNSSTFD